MSTRPLAMACHGMVAAPHHQASLAGLRALERGGTAVDAAIAMNAVLGVVYPHMTGIGGDAFWLCYDNSTGTVHALNGSGRAAREATPGHYAKLGLARIPETGPLAAATVPGAVASWAAASARFGKLDWGSLLEPAIRLARDGAPVAAGVAKFCAEHASSLLAVASTTPWFMADGRAPVVGEVVVAPTLAATLEQVAATGAEAFYTGPIAEEIVRSVRAAGGLLHADDFAEHRSDWAEPVSSTYRGVTCYQHPPNSQGLVHLLMLNILERFDLAAMGDGSADHLHVIAEATKLAYAERERHLTDPDLTDGCVVERLLSAAHAAELADRLSLATALPAQTHDPNGDTTCTVAVDRFGNAASVIQSICHAFGSGFVAGNSGVLLHNRGAKFSLDPGHVNLLRPGRRTLHTLMPSMAFRDGKPWLIYGTMGGDGQPQVNTATLTRMVDFGHDAQSALDAPRALYGQFWGARSNDLWLESRLSGAADSLRARGHHVTEVADWADIMGHAQVIEIDHERGITTGGSDPRGDGLALG